MKNKNRLGNFLYFLPRLAAVAVFMAVIAMTALSHFDVIEPYLYPLHAAHGKIREVTPNIIFGHYPNSHEIKDLKKRGVTIDISLLNLSLPQERVLYEQLKKSTTREGIEIQSFPLSYLSLDSPENRRTVARVAAFVKQNSTRKVYIHCYLGRHRVKVVEEELKRQGLLK